MTGLSRQMRRGAKHFCILNGYAARSTKVFCKQTADRWNKKFFPTKIYLYVFCLAGPNEQSDKFSAKLVWSVWRY